MSISATRRGCIKVLTGLLAYVCVLSGSLFARDLDKAQGVPTPFAARLEARIVLTNACMALEIAPAMGARITSMRLRGGRELMWQSPESQHDMWGWRNWGGDKTWLGPDSRWKALIGAAWPPPQFLEGAWQVVSQSASHVEMLSNLDPLDGTRIRRRITLLADTSVRIDLSRTEPRAILAGEDAVAAPVLWNVTQLPRPEGVESQLLGEWTPGISDKYVNITPEGYLSFTMAAEGESYKSIFKADFLRLYYPDVIIAISRLGDESAERKAEFYCGYQESVKKGTFYGYVEAEFSTPSATQSLVIHVEQLSNRCCKALTTPHK